MVRRSLAFAAALVAALAFPAVSASAGGGGGCHGRTTQGTGGTVEMIEACFTPTTLRIAPGGTVTFVNRDPIVHNVGGDGWGSTGSGLDEDETFTARFDEPGVYPYACTYHWGMTGAVVVGHGIGAAKGDELQAASLEPLEPEIRTVTRTVERAEPWALLAAGALGTLLGAGAAAGIAASRRRWPRERA